MWLRNGHFKYLYPPSYPPYGYGRDSWEAALRNCHFGARDRCVVLPPKRQQLSFYFCRGNNKQHEVRRAAKNKWILPGKPAQTVGKVRSDGEPSDAGGSGPECASAVSNFAMFFGCLFPDPIATPVQRQRVTARTPPIPEWRTSGWEQTQAMEEWLNVCRKLRLVVKFVVIRVILMRCLRLWSHWTGGSGIRFSVNNLFVSNMAIITVLLMEICFCSCFQFPQASEEARSLGYAMWQEEGLVGS